MKKNRLARLSLILLFVLTPLIAWSDSYEGYTLFGPNNSRYTYLVDMDNTVVKTWHHSITGGYSAYLLENGHVIRPASANNYYFSGGGSAGIVQEYNWDDELVWQFTYSSNQYLTHHDIEPLPDGNVLLVAWELKSASEARQAGFNRSSSLWPDHIIEVQPDGDDDGIIVWEWHAWDHLIQDYDPSRDNYGVVGDHPELLDINMSGGGHSGDWMHVNGISYNQELDQIVFSSHTLNEIYVIDHSTTTSEAAGHSGGNSGMGGDILYRWGNPSNYDAPGSEYFDVVHCGTWVPEGCPGEGNIMAFNNREGTHSSIVAEIEPPVDSEGNYSIDEGSAFEPSSPTWTYQSSGFYSNHLGGCQRLPNGNTLLVESTSGYIFEVDENGSTQWSYARGGEISRALRYGTDYSGLFPTGIEDDNTGALPEKVSLLQNYPNPFNGSTVINFSLETTCPITLTIYNMLGRLVKTLKTETLTAGNHQVIWDSTDDNGNTVCSGTYFCVLKAGNQMESRKLVLIK